MGQKRSKMMKNDETHQKILKFGKKNENKFKFMFGSFFFNFWGPWGPLGAPGAPKIEFYRIF